MSLIRRHHFTFDILVGGISVGGRSITPSSYPFEESEYPLLRSLIPRATMGEGGAGGGVGGDLLRKELPIIQDLGERLVVFSSRRFKRGAEAEQGGDEGIGLVALFGGE